MEAKLTSNCREMLAVLKGVSAFTETVQKQHLLVHSDNMTTVANISRQGGAHSPQLLGIVKKLQFLILSLKTTIKIVHIRGTDNILADSASRDEYSLTCSALQRIAERFGMPTVDLFATRSNRLVPAYVSRYPEKEALATDAFSTDWSQHELPIAHPSIRLIPKVLRRVDDQRIHRLILVLPDWPSLPFYPLILSRAVARPLKLSNEYVSQGRHDRLSQVASTSMIAVLISARFFIRFDNTAVIDRLVNNTRLSTSMTYKTAWKRYVELCDTREFTIERVDTFLTFLAYLDEDGLMASTIRSYAAVTSTEIPLGQNIDVDRFLNSL